MQCVVLGAGIVGSAAAWDLVERGHDVLVADVDAGRARHAAAGVGARAAVVDATDQGALRRLLDAVDVVVSATHYSLGVAVAEAGIATGTHVLDFGGNPSVVARQLALGAEARQADVAVVPDCGLAPGLANVLAVAAIAALDDPSVVRIRVGALPLRPVGALGYQLAFSPAGLVNEYAEPCEVLHDGRVTTVEPLSDLEQLDWHGTPLEAFSTAGGTSRLAQRWAGHLDHLDYKTLRHPGHHAAFRAMYELGLFAEDAHGEPRATLLRALATHLPRGAPDVVLVRVTAEGRAGRTRTFEVEDHHDGRWSALARTTAFPATALADLLVTGAVTTRGVAVQHDAVAPDVLLGALARTGIVVREGGAAVA